MTLVLPLLVCLGAATAPLAIRSLSPKAASTASATGATSSEAPSQAALTGGVPSASVFDEAESAQWAARPETRVVDLRGAVDPDLVYGVLRDGVDAWIRTLKGHRDQWGNQVPEWYMEGPRPKAVCDDLKAFLKAYYEERPQLGIQILYDGPTGAGVSGNVLTAADFAGAGANASGTEGRRAGDLDAEDGTDGEGTSSGTSTSGTSAGGAGEGDEGSDDDEDVPDLQAGRRTFTDSIDSLNPEKKKSPPPVIPETADDKLRKKLEAEYGVTILGKWPTQQLHLLAQALSLMPKSWPRGLRIRLSSEERGRCGGYYCGANRTATILPLGKHYLHVYTHEILHHTTIINYADKRLQLFKLLGWRETGPDQWVCEGAEQNFPSQYARTNPYEHVAELLSFYVENKAAFAQQYTPDVVSLLEAWMWQG